MYYQDFLRRGALLGAVATGAIIALLPARAQTPVPAAAPAALTSPAAGVRAAACAPMLDQVRFDSPLPRLGRLIAAGKPIKIVALGSSSTFGAGASSSAASYPSRLAEDLAHRFPGRDITVLNRGVNGDEIAGMLARLESAVIAEKPDLVLWQVGTNSLLRDRAVPPHASMLHEGLARLKATGAEVVLIDPQYAPRVLAKPNVEGMVSLIATAAKAEHVPVFHRFDLMRHWHESDHLPFETFVSSDGLHMNDWSYACVAKALGMAIAEAATRPTATAISTQAVR
jgi:acyl-CoA thioesterase-1